MRYQCTAHCASGCACNNQFTVTRATAKQIGSLRHHSKAWIQHAKIKGSDTGDNIMWLLTPPPGTDTVSVRELMLAMQALQQLPNLQIGVLMRDVDISAFVQHWDASDKHSTMWANLHLFKNVTGLHSFVASRIATIRHLCAVSGAIGTSLTDMYVSDEAVLHAVVHDGSFVYNLPPQWPMAIVSEDMPMLATENGVTYVQTRGDHNERCSTIEIRQNSSNLDATTSIGASRVRLLYISTFCGDNGVTHPVQWLQKLLQNESDVLALQNDTLLLSLVLRATHTPVGRPRTQPPNATTSPHLHRSITQQMDTCNSKI